MKVVCVPAGWSRAELQQLVYFQRGFDITKAQQKPGDIPVISSSGVTSFHNEAKAQGPGIVIGRKGTLGSIHFTERAYWPHDTTLWSKEIHGNNARFVYYYLHLFDFQHLDVGNANPTLNRNHIHKLEIAIPPKSIQDAIATVLGAYDDLIATNQRRIALLEDAARSLYHEWFVHLRFPGHESVPVKDGVPEGWLSLTLGDVCDAVGGGTPSTARPEYWGGDVTWVTPTDVTRNDCLVLLDSEKKITEAGLANSSAQLVPPETILMTSRASIGFFALMDKPACTNQGFISVLPKQDSARMFLLFNLLGRVEEMIGLATGATFKELSKKTFRALPVLWPTDALLKLYEDKTYPLIQQVRLIKKQNQELTKARDLLLPKLMSGQLDVSGIPLPEVVAA